MKTELQFAISLLIAHAEGDFVSKAHAKESAVKLQNYLNKLDSDQSVILAKIIDEVDRAQLKHPNWPEDMVYAASIIGEEKGELTRAANQYEMEGGDLESVITEAIQTAATCIRLLLNLSNR